MFSLDNNVYGYTSLLTTHAQHENLPRYQIFTSSSLMEKGMANTIKFHCFFVDIERSRQSISC